MVFKQKVLLADDKVSVTNSERPGIESKKERRDRRKALAANNGYFTARALSDSILICMVISQGVLRSLRLPIHSNHCSLPYSRYNRRRMCTG